MCIYIYIYICVCVVSLKAQTNPLIHTLSPAGTECICESLPSAPSERAAVGAGGVVLFVLLFTCFVCEREKETREGGFCRDHLLTVTLKKVSF